VNQPVTKWVILSADHATRSDHEVIEWEVEAARQDEAHHEKVLRWSLPAIPENEMEAAEKLWAELQKERAHLDTACTEG
jgi:hypothetical protein